MAFTNDRPSQRHYGLVLRSRNSGGAEGPSSGYSSTATGSVTENSVLDDVTRSRSTTRVFSLDTANKQTVSSKLEIFRNTSSREFGTVGNTGGYGSQRSTNIYSIFRTSSNTQTRHTSSYTLGGGGGATTNRDAFSRTENNDRGVTSVGSSVSFNGSISYTSETFSREGTGTESASYVLTGRTRTVDSTGGTGYSSGTTTGFSRNGLTTTASYAAVSSRNNYSVLSTSSTSKSQSWFSSTDQSTGTNIVGSEFSTSSSSTFNNTIGAITQGTRTTTYKDDFQFFSRGTRTTELTKPYTTTQGGFTGTSSYVFLSSVTSFENYLTVTLPTISSETVSNINSRLNLLTYRTIQGGAGAYLTGGNTLQNSEVIGASRTTSVSEDALSNVSYNTYSFNLNNEYSGVPIEEIENEFVSNVTRTTFITRQGTRLTRVPTTPTYGFFDFGLKTVNSITYVTQTYSSGIATTSTGFGQTTTLKQTRTITGKRFTFSGSSYTPIVRSTIYLAGDTTSEYTVDALIKEYNTTFTTVIGPPSTSFSTSGGGYTGSKVVDRPGHETLTRFAGKDNLNRHTYYTLGKAANGGLHYKSELKASNNIEDFGGISITCDRAVLTTYTLTVPTNATNTAGTDIRVRNETLGTTSYRSDGLPLGIRLSGFSGVEFLPTNSNWFIIHTGSGYQLTISHYSNRTSSMKAKISAEISFSSSDGVPTTVSGYAVATGSIKVDAGSPFTPGRSKQYYSTLLDPNFQNQGATIIHGDDFADEAAFYTHANSHQLYNFTAKSAGSTRISTNTVANTTGTSSRSLPKNAMLFINSTTKAQNGGSPSIVYNAQLE